MNNVKTIFIVILSLLLSYSCSDDESKIMKLKVAPYKVKYEPPFGESNIMGYAVTDEDNHEYVIDFIDGFKDKYEEGYEYLIKVKAVPRGDSKNPVMDESGYHYYLLEIISKEKKEL